MIRQRKTKKKKLKAKATYCTEQILKATNDYILQMGNKLNHAKVDPKAHWSISNKFLYNKKILAKKFISDFASICKPINHGSALQNESFKFLSQVGHTVVTISQ